MTFDQRGEDHQDELLNMTSMVDVVFILLAFFVLTAQFVGQERDISVAARARAAAADAPSHEDLPPAIVVRLLANEGGGAAGVMVGRVRLEPGDWQGLTAMLHEINVPEIPVVLEPDARLAVESVTRAIEAVLASPMQRVSLADARPAEAAAGRAAP